MFKSFISVFTVFVELFLQVTVLVIKTLLEICYKTVCSFEQAISKTTTEEKKSEVSDEAEVPAES